MAKKRKVKAEKPVSRKLQIEESPVELEPEKSAAWPSVKIFCLCGPCCALLDHLRSGFGF